MKRRMEYIGIMEYYSDLKKIREGPWYNEGSAYTLGIPHGAGLSPK